MIVIHPGKAKEVTFSGIARAMRYIRDAYANACTTVPSVLIQNGYPSLIQSGADIRDFWLTMQVQVPECCDTCGVLLDTSALETAAHHAKTPLSTHLAPLPAESLKGFFLRPADAESDGRIPWESIFRGIQMLPHDALLIPDVNHPDEMEEMLARCRAGLTPRPEE